VATNAYETVSGFKNWVILGDTLDDNTIDDALEAASRGIDNYCNTHFWQTTAGTARFFDTCDAWEVRIGDAVAVTEVATDPTGDGTFDTVWAASDYQLLPRNITSPEPMPYTSIRAVATRSFPYTTGRRVGLIRVTGTFGWPEIPAAIVQATRLLANRLIKRKNSPEGVAGFDEFGTVRISMRDDPDAVRYITPYATTRRAGGWAFA
jgi:hypothetical protein